MSDVPGIPYEINLSLIQTEPQNKARTTSEDSAILPSIPFRIISQTAGTLLMREEQRDVRRKNLWLKLPEITLAISHASIDQCSKSRISNRRTPILSRQFIDKSIYMCKR